MNTARWKEPLQYIFSFAFGVAVFLLADRKVAPEIYLLMFGPVYWIWVSVAKDRVAAVSAWMFYAGGWFVTMWGSVSAIMLIYKTSNAVAVTGHLLSSFAFHFLVPFVILFWRGLSRKLHLSHYQTLLLLPLALYLNDRFLQLVFTLSFATALPLSSNPLRHSMSLFGLEGLSYFIYLGSVLVLISAHLFYRRHLRTGLAVTAFALLAGCGLWFLSRAEEARWKKSDAQLNFALLQPNTDYKFRAEPEVYYGQEAEFVEGFAKRMAAFKEQRLALNFVLLPEAQFLTWPNSDLAVALRVRGLAKEFSTPIFGGFWTGNFEGQRYNSLVFIGRDGAIDHYYHKVLLMPFGEFRPFTETFPALSEFFPGRDEFFFGPTLVDAVREFEGVKYGMSICYEDIFSEVAASHTDLGAEILLNVSSDAMFGDSNLPLSHANLAAGRALEARRPLVRATRTGVSVVMKADGELLAMGPLNQSYEKIVELPYLKNPPLSFYHRTRRAWPWIFILISAAMIIAARWIPKEN